MPFTPVPLCVRLAVNLRQEGRDMANIFHVAVDSAATPADVAYLAEHTLAAYHTNFGALQSAALHSISCQAMALDSVSAPAFTFVNDQAGTDGSSETFPLNVALVVRWATATRYRGGHARTYLPGIQDATRADASHILSAMATNLTNAATSFRSDINALTPPDCAPIELSVVHYHRAHLALVPPEVEPISGGSVSSRLHSQRRRLG